MSPLAEINCQSEAAMVAVRPMSSQYPGHVITLDQSEATMVAV